MWGKAWTFCHPDPRSYWEAPTHTPISEDRGDLLPSAFPLDQRADGVLTGKKDQDERDLGRHRLLVTWVPRVTAELRSPVTALTRSRAAAILRYFLTHNAAAIVTHFSLFIFAFSWLPETASSFRGYYLVLSAASPDNTSPIILPSSDTKAHYFPYSPVPALKFDYFSLIIQYHVLPLPV